MGVTTRSKQDMRGKMTEYIEHKCAMCPSLVPHTHVIKGVILTYSPAVHRFIQTCSLICRRLLVQKQASDRTARQGGVKKPKVYILTEMDKYLGRKN